MYHPAEGHGQVLPVWRWGQGSQGGAAMVCVYRRVYVCMYLLNICDITCCFVIFVYSCT